MKKVSLIYIIIAGLMWGSSCIFIHYLSPFGFTAAQMTAARGSVSFLCIAIYALIRDRSKFRVPCKELPLFAGIGVSVYLTAYWYYRGVQMTSSATAAVLMYMAPVYVMIFSVAFLGESFSLWKGISVAGMLGGCFLVSGIVGGLKFDPLGILLAILSGVSYAAYILLAKISIKRGNDPLSATVYGFLVMAILSAIPAKLWEMPGLIWQNPRVILPLLIGLGVITFVIPYFLYTLSMRSLPAGTASALAVVEPFSATVYSIVLLGETLTVYSVIGILLILASVIALGILETNNRSKPPVETINNKGEST